MSPEVVAAAYVRYHGLVRAYFHQRDTVELEDLAQEAWATVVANDYTPDNWQAWLYGVARHVWLHHLTVWRTGKRGSGTAPVPLVDDLDSAPEAEFRVELADLERLIPMLLGSLRREEEREMARVMFAGLKQTEARQALGLDKATAHRRWHKVVARIEEIADWYRSLEAA